MCLSLYALLEVKRKTSLKDFAFSPPLSCDGNQGQFFEHILWSFTQHTAKFYQDWPRGLGEDVKRNC